LAGETKVLGENLPQCRFDNHKPYMPAQAAAVAVWIIKQHKILAVTELLEDNWIDKDLT
jgi:hypothetical protein